jgi:transposase
MVRLKEDERVRVCTLLDENLYTPSELAREYKVRVSTITRLYEKYKQTRSTKDLPKSGRPRLITGRTERRAIRYIVSGECSTATDVQKKLQYDHNLEVSSSTVRRAFKNNGLKSAVKVKKPLLSVKHKKKRYKFAKKYRHWNFDDWRKVIWSDESKFNIFGSDGREYCWKFKGEPLKDHHIKGTVKFGGGGVFVWGCMTAEGIGNLCKIDGGLDAALYCQILEEDFLGTLEYYNLDLDNVIFQQDNDPKHTARVTKEWLEENNVIVLEWPAQSPDLNPIEHIWSEVERRLRKLDQPVKNKNDLWDKIQTVWNNIEVNVCTKLIETMPERIKDVYLVKGGYTRW